MTSVLHNYVSFSRYRAAYGSYFAIVCCLWHMAIFRSCERFLWVCYEYTDHMPMNTASHGLSVHSKRHRLSGCVSTGKALSENTDLVFRCVLPMANGNFSQL